MKFEIEQEYRPLLGCVQFYVIIDGKLGKSFDTRELAEAFCDHYKKCYVPTERWEYIPKRYCLACSNAKPLEAGEECCKSCEEQDYIDRHTTMELNNE